MNNKIHDIISEVINNYNWSEFLKWKKDNVTYRGITELGKENGGMGKYGSGLYTVPLSNKSMARQYGKLYYVLNAKPKKPKILNDVNGAEMFIQNIIYRWCVDRGLEYDPNKFYDDTSINAEMQRLGYDGLMIKGREMVNYTPDEDNIRYFENDNQLIQYYENIILK